MSNENYLHGFRVGEYCIFRHKSLFFSMQQIYFISDIHLDAYSPQFEKQKAESLISFLDALRREADILYIVGDLYDFWFEYRQAIPKVNLKILSRLEQLVEAGTEVRYFLGNHDLWQDGYLEREIGVKMYREPLEVEHNSLRFYIAHGDGLVGADRASRVRSRIFKSRLNIFLYRLLHPDVGIPFAKFVAAKSRERGENPYDKEYRDFALSKFREGVDVVVLGHTHKPLFEAIDSNYYVNLGEWGRQYHYLELNGTQLQFNTWNVDSDSKKLHRSTEV